MSKASEIVPNLIAYASECAKPLTLESADPFSAPYSDIHEKLAEGKAITRLELGASGAVVPSLAVYACCGRGAYDPALFNAIAKYFAYHVVVVRYDSHGRKQPPVAAGMSVHKNLLLGMV